MDAAAVAGMVGAVGGSMAGAIGGVLAARVTGRQTVRAAVEAAKSQAAAEHARWARDRRNTAYERLRSATQELSTAYWRYENLADDSPADLLRERAGAVEDAYLNLRAAVQEVRAAGPDDTWFVNVLLALLDAANRCHYAATGRGRVRHENVGDCGADLDAALGEFAWKTHVFLTDPDFVAPDEPLIGADTDG
ncbi:MULTISPECIES: hypothetical protein [unclassified Streptomyces]|uniref:hypothetical protein n=1 Tax=unclassified Streptomyces TaxID=2593676 RepID=UPI0037B26956